MQVQVDWESDLRFKASTGGHHSFGLDSKSTAAPSPMETLLASVGGCMGIDVVDILLKMRQPLKGLSIALSGDRNSEPPKYFTELNLKFYITGEVDPEKAARAVALSFEKYCSVFHSLRPDIEVSHSIEVSGS